MKFFLLSTFLLLSLCIQAQDQKSPEVSNKVFSVNFLTPGLELESKLSEKTTIDLNLTTGFALTGGSNRDTEFGIFPTFESQYRFYYNLEKRMKKGKNIENNSGNYVGAMASIRSGKPIIGDIEFEDDFAVFLGPVWGLQRYYGSGFKLNLNLGAGYVFDNADNSYVSLLVGLRLGWKLGK
ncbi:hypothetical protein JM83_0661 [Gillisia sp. Hel_I_86]|uniref:hypothetical protein n=1 Tax=Gillisia sp. Hel_I_86 TaxID=1249981 RepID=UPI00119B9D2C|nr:hypothetical protein [Gillisia sp. Hel_I_86]TVZ25732.1 hypothetical protein JM83_0661 [Gillisia sp. Hel_I_86]